MYDYHSTTYVGSRHPSTRPKMNVVRKPDMPRGERTSARRTAHGASFLAGGFDAREVMSSGDFGCGPDPPSCAVASDDSVDGLSSARISFAAVTSHLFRSFCSITSSRKIRSMAQMMMQKMKGARHPNLK